jgi:glutathione S-transferase
LSLTVHHLNYSRSTRILWLLEEMGLEYEIQRYERDPRTFRAPPELARVHPLGRAPVVTDGDLVLAESGAIVEYFVDKTGLLGPQTDEERVRFRFFLHYAEGSVMPPLLVRLLMSKVKTAPVPFFIKPIARQIASKVEGAYSDGEIDRHFTFLDAELAGREWLLGDRLTAADVQMLYPLEAGLSRGAGDRPNIAAWLRRVQARPAYQRAMEKGGPLVPPE